MSFIFSALFPSFPRPLADKSMSQGDLNPVLAGTLGREKAKEGEGPF
jgi:hypothetical protein